MMVGYANSLVMYAAVCFATLPLLLLLLVRGKREQEMRASGCLFHFRRELVT